MPALTPLALEHAAVLRRFAPGRPPIDSLAALAREFGRDRANFHKTIKLLVEADLLARPADDPHGVPRLSDAGQAALDAIARAEAGAGSGGGAEALPAGWALLAHDRIAPDPDQPRRTFDDAGLDALADDIAERGLLQNLVVRPAPDGRHTLVSGERRWRAIGRLIDRGARPADQPIMCQVRDVEGLDLAVTALVENLQRENLNGLDEALAYARLIERHGLDTAAVAARVGRSRRHVQDRLRFLTLPDVDKVRLRLPADHPGHLSPTEARRILTTPRAEPPAAQPEPEPAPARPEGFDAYIWGHCDVLNAADRRTLAEVEHRIRHHPSGDGSVVTWGGDRGGPSVPLVMAGVSIHVRRKASTVILDPAAVAWLRHHGLIIDGQVERYGAAWLNPPGPADAPTPTGVDPALVVAGVAYPNLTRANEARALLAGGHKANHGGGARAERPGGPSDSAPESPRTPCAAPLTDPGAAGDTDAWDRTPDQVEADRQLLAEARALNQGAPWSDKAAGFRALLARMGLAAEGGFAVHPDDPCTITLSLEGADPARIFPVVTVDQHSEWPDERAEALATLLVGALNRALRGRDPAQPAPAEPAEVG